MKIKLAEQRATSAEEAKSKAEDARKYAQRTYEDVLAEKQKMSEAKDTIAAEMEMARGKHVALEEQFKQHGDRLRETIASLESQLQDWRAKSVEWQGWADKVAGLDKAYAVLEEEADYLAERALYWKNAYEELTAANDDSAMAAALDLLMDRVEPAGDDK